MSYEIKGKIIAVLEKKTGVVKSNGNNWMSQSYVIETNEAYPKKMCFEVFGEEKIKESNIQLMEELTVTFEIDAREYNGRWYNSFKMKSIKRENKIEMPDKLNDLPIDFFDPNEELPLF
jgi:hypothetical protein